MTISSDAIILCPYLVVKMVTKYEFPLVIVIKKRNKMIDDNNTLKTMTIVKMHLFHFHFIILYYDEIPTQFIP